MQVRLTRVTLFFITLIMGFGFYRLIDFLLQDLETQTLQATEEAMIDTAHLLANFVENGLDVEKGFTGMDRREIEARVFSLVKDRPGMNAYLTNQDGIVIFDTGQPGNTGKDFSGWSDVFKTLDGRYGARSTRTDEADATSSVMHVGAPVRRDGKITGVLTVYKAQADVLPFVRNRRETIIWATALIGLGILALIVAVFIWLFRPIGLLTAYARAIARGERRSRPQVGHGREVNTLANALHDMREALEGRRYAERYIQTLTHELKSPLAAILGAAELLGEEMPRNERGRFVENIRSQTHRCQHLIHQLLELSSLEAASHLEDVRSFDLAETARDCLHELAPRAQASSATLVADLPSSLPFHGNEPLISSALKHLLQNALDFSPPGGSVTLAARQNTGEVIVTVTDEGPGIPEFAARRAFERFYSFRPGDQIRGNGLGLAFVREVVELHHGTVTIEMRKEGGTRAAITLPVSPETGQ
jgi:two-component system sensor histidine kinase CreC